MSARNGNNNRRKGAHTPLANIVRQETRDGRLIVRFLVDAMQGKLDGAKPHHRLDAARQLLAIGFDGAQAFIDPQHPGRPAPRRRQLTHGQRRQWTTSTPSSPSSYDRRPATARPPSVSSSTSCRAQLPDFKPHHRLAAARELLHRGFDNANAEDPDDDYDDDRRPSRRRPSRRPQGTAKTTPRDRNQNGRSSLAERDLVEKHYGSEDMSRKAVENTVFGKIELEDRKTFENLPDHKVEALIQQYGSPKAWFAAVEKFAKAEATLEQLLSGSIDLDDTANADSGERDRRGDPHADDSYAPQEEPPPEEPPPKPPNEPSEWDLRAYNKVLDSTTLMAY